MYTGTFTFERQTLNHALSQRSLPNQIRSAALALTCPACSRNVTMSGGVRGSTSSIVIIIRTYIYI